MAERNEVYKCEICGNIIEVLHGGTGQLVCCGEPMKLLKENTVDASLEKHVPIISKPSQGVLVQIGSIPHPMEEKHFIQFIDCYQNERYLGRAMLSPGVYPAACFHLKEPTGKVTITEHCNLHGYWKTEIEL